MTWPPIPKAMKRDEPTFDEIVDSIHELNGHETEEIPWLMSLLDSPDGAIRLAALNALVHRFSIANLAEKLLVMLDREIDEDVLLVLLSALSMQHRGSRNEKLIHRFQAALHRIGRCFDGTREAFDDAKLRVMLGYDTKQIVKMSSTDRLAQLSDVNAKLGPK